MGPVLVGGPGDDLAGQGRNRARHRDRAGPDRRRRTRCRYRPRADGPRIDGGQPQRGGHLGQSFGPAIGTRDAACLRRSPADISERASDGSASGATCSTIKDGTISGPGNIRTSYWELAEEVSLDREATPGAVAKSSARRALAGQFGAAAGYSRQGIRAGRVSFTTPRCLACCMAACCDRKCRRAKLVA